LKHEIFRETVGVTFDLLIQALGCNPVNLRQIGVQNHALAADGKNQWLDRFDKAFLHGPWFS